VHDEPSVSVAKPDAPAPIGPARSPRILEGRLDRGIEPSFSSPRSRSADVGGRRPRPDPLESRRSDGGVQHHCAFLYQSVDVFVLAQPPRWAIFSYQPNATHEWAIGLLTTKDGVLTVRNRTCESRNLRPICSTGNIEPQYTVSGK